MALEKRWLNHRNQKLKEFTPGKKIRPVIYDTDKGEIVARGRLRERKRDWGYTGVNYTEAGKFARKPDKSETQVQIDHGFIYVQGVKVANLQTDSIISKRSLNWTIANLKGQATKWGKTKYKPVNSRIDILQMLSALYPDSGGIQSDLQAEYEASGTEFVGQLPAKLPENTKLYKRRPGNYYIDNFFVIDTEDNSQGDIKMFNLYDGDVHRALIDQDSQQLQFDIWQFLEMLFGRDGARIFCTNLQYDLNNMFGDVWKSWNPIFSGSILLSVELPSEKEDKKNRTKVKFYESLGQIPLGVEAMGKAIGLSKLDPGTNRIDLEYCQRDCEIVHKTLNKIFIEDKKNKVEFGLTLGAKSLKHFRTYYISKSIPQRNFTEFKPAYRGGRCEIFKTGKQPHISTFDINSLYPYVMSKYDYPDPKDAIKTTKISDLGVFFVRVVVDEKTYVPYLGKVIENKYIFPVGEFFGLYTGFELRQAHNLGQLKEIEVVEGFKFRSMGNVFKPFIDTFYEIRKQSDDKIIDKYNKIFMNALYGKFGQSNKSLEYDPDQDVFVESLGKFPAHANQIWALFTTVFARHELFYYLNKYMEYLVYCDTDSVHLKDWHSIDQDEIGPDLGLMKPEGEFEFGNYLQPKVYSLNHKIEKESVYKAKGIPGDRIENINGQDIKINYKKLFIETGEATFRRPVKTIEYLRNQYNNSKNPKINLLKLNDWMIVSKKLTSEYKKREIINNNGDTKPIKLFLKKIK